MSDTTESKATSDQKKLKGSQVVGCLILIVSLGLAIAWTVSEITSRHKLQDRIEKLESKTRP